MSAVVVRGGQVVLGGALVSQDLSVEDGVVVDSVGSDAAVVDAAGCIVAPGFVDLQCNGALGIDLATEPERLWELGAALPRWGVTAWLPTIVTTPDGVIDRALAALSAGPPEGWLGARPLGLHLEGPFLAPGRKGAHRVELLREPSPARTDGWSRSSGVTMVTLAPELDGALELIAGLADRGVVVSLGHSGATEAQARAAVDAGARTVTHLFNAMSPLHHREPGLPGVALTDERLLCGVIADGVHVHPTAVAIALRLLGDRLALVTDAVGALGLPSGTLALGGATVTAAPDGVRLADGTLAGSNLSMDHAVRNLVAFTGCPAEVALLAASAAPAQVLDDPSRGSLTPGSRGDVVLLSPTLDVVGTLVGGRVVEQR